MFNFTQHEVIIPTYEQLQLNYLNNCYNSWLSIVEPVRDKPKFSIPVNLNLDIHRNSSIKTLYYIKK